jgi:perosamine synthetase
VPELTPIPLSVPDLRGREAEYLAQCVSGNWVSSAGPFVTAFEERMATIAGCAHAIATSSGTSALKLALIAAGVRSGDLVAVPDWTFAATANAVVHAGAEPVFIDVDASTWAMDPERLAVAVRRLGSRIKAVVPVHTLGHPADMDAIVEAAAGRPVIEDAAGAIGARYHGRPVGSLGRAAIFSFNGNKTVTAGGGGMVVTDDKALAATVRHLSTQARVGPEYRHDHVGFNDRMTNLSAAVGIAQLERLDEMLATKRRIAAGYDRACSGRDDVVTMPRANWAESGCWLYSILTASEADAQRLVTTLAAQKIEARVFWQGLAAQAPYASFENELNGTSARLSGRVVSLPCSTHLTDADQARVIAALAGWRGARISDLAA